MTRFANSTLLATVLGLAAAAPAQVLDWQILTPGNTGIPGDSSNEIFIGSDDRPWISGFQGFRNLGGMGRWDEATNTWEAFSNVDHPELPSPRFGDIDADSTGTLWIATDEGLVSYDPAVGATSIAVYDASNSPMPNNWVRMVSVAPDDSIWLAIRNSFGPFGGLVRFAPATNVWNVWTTANGLPWGNQWPGWDWIDFAEAAPDDDGGYTVYFGSAEMGAASFKDGVFTSFVSDPPPTGPVVWGVPGNDSVDDLGNTWLSTDQGLVRRTPDGALTVVPLPPGGSGRVEAFSGGRCGLASNQGNVWVYDGAAWTNLGAWGGGSVFAIAEEASGEVWVSGNAGAARFADGTWQRYRLTNTGMVGYSVQTIDFDAAGNVYMNGNAGPTVGGFSVYDGERWTCVNSLNYGLGPVWGQPTDDVEFLALRDNGNMAVDAGGITGLKEWDGANYTPLNPVETYEADEDALGRLWSGGWGALYRYLPGGGFVTYDTNNSPMFDFFVRVLVADELRPGFVWAATGMGIVHTDGVSWRAYSGATLGIGNEVITDLDPAADGTIWVATSVGILHFDPVTLQGQLYDKSNSSLPSDDVDHVVVTPDGSVWATSFDFLFPFPGGLTRFDGTTWTTWTMDDSPLPHNQVWELTARPTADGYEVWVGTASEGVAVISVLGELCQEDLGFGGPGAVALSVCGDPLATGGTADLLLTGAPASAAAWLLTSTSFAPTPFKGGTLVTVPFLLATPLPIDGTGEASIAGIPGGIGPLDIYLQAVVADAAQSGGFGLSNALRVEFLP